MLNGNHARQWGSPKLYISTTAPHLHTRPSPIAHPMSASSSDHAPPSVSPPMGEVVPLTLDNLRSSAQAEAQHRLAANVQVQAAAGVLSALATGPSASQQPDPREPLTPAALRTQVLAEAHRRASGNEYVQGAHRALSGILAQPGAGRAEGGHAPPSGEAPLPGIPGMQELQGFLSHVPGVSAMAGAAGRALHANTHGHREEHDRGAYTSSPVQTAPPAVPSLVYAPSDGRVPGGSRQNSHGLDWIVPRSDHGSTKEDTRRSYATDAPLRPPSPQPAQARRGLSFGLPAFLGGADASHVGRPNTRRHSELKLGKTKGTLAERLMPTLEIAQEEEARLRSAGKRSAHVCATRPLTLRSATGGNMHEHRDRAPGRLRLAHDRTLRCDRQSQGLARDVCVRRDIDGPRDVPRACARVGRA
jgi:hypothetical protein